MMATNRINCRKMEVYLKSIFLLLGRGQPIHACTKNRCKLVGGDDHVTLSWVVMNLGKPQSSK